MFEETATKRLRERGNGLTGRQAWNAAGRGERTVGVETLPNRERSAEGCSFFGK